jgi:deoxycytidylate deaminase
MGDGVRTDGAVPRSELVIALVAAIGTDVGMVANRIATELTTYGYESQTLRLSSYLAEYAGVSFVDMPFDEGVSAAMDAGDLLRQSWERGDALALHAVSDIVAERGERADVVVEPVPGQQEPATLPRFAFILRSLKTPEELNTLRAIYGSHLVVVGAYSPRASRLEHLAAEIGKSRENEDRSTWTHQPETLVERDEREEMVEAGGQDVRGTFHLADFFVRADDEKVAKEDIERTCAVLFGDPFRTPTRDEHAQFVATGAALRSSEMGRQVGAAITDRDGSVLAVGTNEVPRPGGGSSWEEDHDGAREFEVAVRDTNRTLLDDLAGRMADAALRHLALADGLDAEIGEDGPGTEAEVRVGLVSTLRDAGLKDLTEFGRATHAEMNAILDAARRGVAVEGGTLYSTTFPCHNCTRHIIGAGLVRVVFIEPYAKSRAGELHGDALVIEDHDGVRVSLMPFVGVAPRRYVEMFDAAAREARGHVARKDDAGDKGELDRATALPVFMDATNTQFHLELPAYRQREALALESFGGFAASAGND